MRGKRLVAADLVDFLGGVRQAQPGANAPEVAFLGKGSVARVGVFLEAEDVAHIFVE